MLLCAQLNYDWQQWNQLYKVIGSCQALISMVGNSCGSVGRVVAFNNKDPWFESNVGNMYLLSIELKRRKYIKRPF